MRRILIVEDNPIDLKLISHIIGKKGHEVYQAVDAFSAIEKLDQYKFNLIILDWMLPKVTGIELLKTIRNQEINKAVPIIFVTGKNDSEDIKLAISRGTTDYLIKPIDPLVLESKISKILGEEDDWKTYGIPSDLGSLASISMNTKVVGISEFGLQFTNSILLAQNKIYSLEMPFLKDFGFPVAQVRVESCIESDGLFIISAVFVGLKETQMRAIRLFLKEKNLLVTSKYTKSAAP